MGALYIEAACYAKVYRGHEYDVLSRYLGAARAYDADIIMRVTGDCPLISPSLCADVLAALKGNDYASNILPRTFPKGFDCEVFTMGTLQAADIHTVDNEREHVTPWMQRADIRRANVANKWKLDGRLTLDTEDDYRTIRAAFGHEADQRLRPS
jgi:spore coat polysaccharide biosynthesis protein SpsF (cytidylyltransferase family)